MEKYSLKEGWNYSKHSAIKQAYSTPNSWRKRYIKGWLEGF